MISDGIFGNNYLKESEVYMKNPIFSCILILLSLVIIAALPTENDLEIYSDTLRLHILAASDTAEDQNLKLALRDGILSEYGERLSDFESVEGAKSELPLLLSDIESYSQSFIEARGFDYPVKATISEEWYETRDYGEFSLPCGYYSSLRVIIGEGEGENWWCVLYPPLCLDMSKSNLYSESEEALIMGKYKLKFKILELASELCR